jgi:uncharacterized repeat protein (TIGR04138 family)
MAEELHPLLKLLRDDPRYRREAYVFVRDGLDYAHETLGLGKEPAGGKKKGKGKKGRRHVTGQELCEALRQFALEQYGYMAKTVLNSWGIRETGDFGEIVYNLIKAHVMTKSDEDRREDFDDVYDFEKAFVTDFVIQRQEG